MPFLSLLWFCRIQEEIKTAMDGLGATHTENDINRITREHTLAREVVAILFFYVSS